LASSLTALFRFVQWEFPGRLGPEPGRYIVRRYAGDDARWIVVIDGLEAAARRPKRKWSKDPEPEPLTVPVTRATVIDALRVEEEAAAAWLHDAGDGEVVTALGVLNRAVHGHRIGAADPYVAEADTQRALRIRIGIGAGEQVADGQWTDVREVGAPRAKRDRSALLRPQERLAAILAGRDVALACETLALRARADLDHGREREAAMQTHLALEAALAELQSYREQSGMSDRLAELDQHRDSLAAAANSALQGGLEPAQVEAVTTTLGRLEAALRAKAAAGAY
jgi:hypothetical protein